MTYFPMFLKLENAPCLVAGGGAVALRKVKNLLSFGAEIMLVAPEIAPELGVDQLTAIHGRAEEYGRMPEYREQFDLVTSRAVADLRMLCELCLPFVKPGGLFLAMKGPNCQEEKDAAGRCITLLGGQLRKDFVYTIPGTEITHRVVVMEKKSSTPDRWPRRFSKIKKFPL